MQHIRATKRLNGAVMHTAKVGIHIGIEDIVSAFALMLAEGDKIPNSRSKAMGAVAQVILRKGTDWIVSCDDTDDDLECHLEAARVAADKLFPEFIE